MMSSILSIYRISSVTLYSLKVAEENKNFLNKDYLYYPFNLFIVLFI